MMHLVSVFLLLQQSASIPTQLGVEVRPDTVTIGEHFTVLLRVRAPAGSTIEFPAGPDSASRVELAAQMELAEPRTVVGPGAGGLSDTLVEQIAGYRLAAWDVGDQPLLFGDILVRHTTGERRITLGSGRVFVRSVLPADTTLHVPKPPRDVLLFGWPPWVKWLLIALAVLLALLIAWWAWRAYRRMRAKPVPPFLQAERDFKRIEAMRLIDKGESGRHVELMADVTRTYLIARVDPVQPSHTSTELIAAARDDGTVDGRMTARLTHLFQQSDLVKFAAKTMDPGMARELSEEARATVIEIEAAHAHSEKLEKAA